MIFKVLFVFLFSMLLISCGGGSSSSSSTENLEDGITFAATATHYPSLTLASENPKSFYNTEGIQITLETAYLVLWSVEFKTNCSDFTTAHADEAPNVMGVPNVINILDTDYSEIYLGQAYPAPGNYCGAEIQLLKADEDTQYLPDDVDMINKLLYIQGEYQQDQTPVPFTLSISTAPLPKSLLFNNIITLSSEQKHATLNLGMYYDRWFDGLEMSAISEPAQQAILLDNIVNSLHQR